MVAYRRFSDGRMMVDVSPASHQAANRAEEAGLSPRAQLDAAKAMQGKQERKLAPLGYQPHQGAREKARRLKRAAAASGSAGLPTSPRA